MLSPSYRIVLPVLVLVGYLADIFVTMTASQDPVTLSEKWTAVSGDYQQRIGEMTKYGIARLVQYINERKPFEKDSSILDVGTGGGSIPIKILEKAPAGTRILATDISPGMLEQVKSLHLPNVSVQQEDACSLSGLKDNTFSHVFSSFAIQFTPDPPATIRQMYRVLKPGGMVGVVIYGDYTSFDDVHIRACRLLKTDFKPTDFTADNSWSSKRDHREQLEAAGFKDVNIDLCLMPIHFNNGTELATFWFECGNPVPYKLLKAAEEQGINLTELRRVMAELVDAEFEGGKGSYFLALLGWGTK